MSAMPRRRNLLGAMAMVVLLACWTIAARGDEPKSSNPGDRSAVGEQPRIAAPLSRPPDDGAPAFAADEAAIRAWIEARKGYGAPQYFDSATASVDMRVLAAWNIPTSGVNYTDFWVYCQVPGGWKLFDSGWFQPPEDQAHSAVLDGKTAEVRFLGEDDAVYHRVSVEGCRQKRP